MESKKINQLATNLSPVSTDLTIIGDPITGVSKKVTLSQIASLFAGAVDFYTNLAAFPATGVLNTIYCAKDTQKLYLWSGSAYVEVFPSQSVLNTYQLLSAKGVANGYAGLDSAGKVPIAQLPSSIMEYKGLWSAATNTPTLANGTGDTGDVYIASSSGSVNFGAGAITFAVGDYVIYSGSIWQRSSGAVGTVTSVGLSSATSGVTIGSSPVTTSGTITLAIATATTSQNGLLSSTDWATFNAKQNAITLTTTGSSGAATLIGATLNIPQYQSALTNPITGTGTSGQVAYFNGTNSITSNAAFAFTPTSQLLVNNSVTAASSIARGTNLTPTLTAAANSDVLVGLDINPTFSNGAFTGVSNIGLRVQNGYISGTTSTLGNMFVLNGANSTLFSVVSQASAPVGSIALNMSVNPSASSLEGAYMNFTGYYESWINVIANKASAGNKYWRVGNLGNSNYFAIQKLTDTGSAISYTALAAFSSTGNIGINTTTDSGFRLDVNGTARVQTAFIIDGTSGGNLNIRNNNTNDWNVGENAGAATRDFNLYNFNTNSINLSVNRLSGNILINTSTDAGFRLDVNGTARVSGNTQIVGDLSVPSGNYISVNGTGGIFGMRIQSSLLTITTNNANVADFSNGSVNGSILRLNQNNITATSGTFSTLLLPNIGGITLAPTSGNVSYNGILINPNFNTTGTYSGAARGIFYNPTLTSVTGLTHIAFQNTTGDVLLGTTSGNVAIGTSTLATATELTLGGSQTASSAIARGQLLNTTLVAAANNDVLVGLDINPTFTNGAFTGVSNLGLRVQGTPASTTSPFVQILNNASTVATNQDIVQILTPNVANGVSYQPIRIGTATSGLNSFSIGYTHVSSGSTSNRVNLSFFGQNNIQTIFASGNIGMGGVTTDSGYKLDVNGTGRFSGKLNLNSTLNKVGLNLIGATGGTDNGGAYAGNGTYYGGGKASVTSYYGDEYGNGAPYGATAGNISPYSVWYGGGGGGYFKGGSSGGGPGGGGAGIVALGGNGSTYDGSAEGGAGIYAKGGLNGDGSTRAWAAYFEGKLAVTGAATFSSTLGIGGVADSVKGGRYTPTLTNNFNITASALVANYNIEYIRVGRKVTVTGFVNITPTTALSFVTLYLTLPIASSTSDYGTTIGTAVNTTSTPVYGVVFPSSNAALIQFYNTYNTIYDVYFSFSYDVT